MMHEPMHYLTEALHPFPPLPNKRVHGEERVGIHNMG